LGAVYQFITPIMKALKGKKEILFYSLNEFEEWSKKESGFTVRYLKGLGSSDSKDFVKYFNEINNHLIQVIIDNPADLEIVDLVFGKTAGAADRRKEWLDIEQE
jgi:DNA topoisomerase-2